MTAPTARRKLLQKIVMGLPAVVASGMSAHIGLLASKTRKRFGAFPGDPTAWRAKFLAQAQAQRAPPVRAEGIDSYVRPAQPRLVRQAGERVLPVVEPTSEGPLKESALLRMYAELKRALEKPLDQRKWIMVIDLQKCIGCAACTLACKAENHTPPGVVYNPVLEEEIGEYPNVTRRFLPRPCQQCDDPPCVPVCPVNATWKRPDGIVVIDYNACIGCRYCLTACPYGARYFDFGDAYTDGTPGRQPYEEAPSPEYGREWHRNGRRSPVGNARKCQFCIHRLDAGMLPACVTTCIGGALHFGDKNDPDSLVSQLAASPRRMRLKEELGTEPKVYYLL